MQYKLTNTEKISNSIKNAGCVPKAIILGTFPKSFRDLIDLRPTIIHLNHKPHKEVPANYIFIQFNINTELTVLFCKDQLYFFQTADNLFNFFLKANLSNRFFDQFIIKVYHNELSTIIQKIFDKLKLTTSVSDLLRQYDQTVRQLQNAIIENNQTKYQALLFSSELWAFTPQVVEELSKRKVNDAENYLIINNMFPNSKPATNPNKFYYLVPLLDQLIELVFSAFDSFYNLAKHKELAIRFLYQQIYINKNKELLKKRILILQKLAPYYPDLQAELEEIKKQLEELENPTCPFQKAKKDFLKAFSNLFPIKEIARKIHTDAVPDKLEALATRLSQLVNSLKQQGDIQAIKDLQNILQYYPRPQKATMIDIEVFQFLINYLEYRLTLNHLHAIERSFIEKPYLQLREEVKQELDKLDKEIKNLEEQLKLLENL